MINLLSPFLADAHREALLAEAEAERRARLARGSQPEVPAWRRLVGRTAVRLSDGFSRVARTADPTATPARGTGRSLAA